MKNKVKKVQSKKPVSKAKSTPKTPVKTVSKAKPVAKKAAPKPVKKVAQKVAAKPQKPVKKIEPKAEVKQSKPTGKVVDEDKLLAAVAQKANLREIFNHWLLREFVAGGLTDAQAKELMSRVNVKFPGE